MLVFKLYLAYFLVILRLRNYENNICSTIYIEKKYKELNIVYLKN